VIDARELALASPRAAGAAAGRARIRVAAEDFQVDEELGFAPSGQGEHVLLQVRKREANTAWVARELARRAGVRHFDVGFAGLKDRHALTTQWFTVPGRRVPAAEWQGVTGEGYEVISATTHSRKLPRGALAANRFRLVLREFEGDAVQLERCVARIARDGVPNYFGPQRFGRDLANLAPVLGTTAASLATPGSRSRERDAFEWSALRSLLFNAVLAERIALGHWTRLHAGERANLDGSNSTFLVEAPDATLESRLAALDIHPTGPLAGQGDPGVTGEIARLEAEVCGRFPACLERLREDRLEAARRPLRVAVRDLTLEWLEPSRTACLSFRLRPGSFATTVLRELIDVQTGTGAEAAEDEHA